MKIDFVIQKDCVYPIEVKAEENLKSKSLSTTVSGTDMKGWRFSMSGYRDQGWMINIPLFFLQEWLKIDSAAE